jgi:hypothetical protein
MRKTIGVLFIIISLVLGIVVYFAWGVQTTLLKSEPWKASLREAKVYDRVLSDLTTRAINDPKQFGEVTGNSPLTAADISGIAQSVIPPAFLQEQVERTLDLVFDIVSSKVAFQQAQLVIPLQDIKHRLPVAVQDVLVKKIRALPICKAKQISEFEKYKSLEVSLPPCRPSNLDPQTIVGEAGKFDEVTKQIPDTIDLVAELKKQNAKPKESCPNSDPKKQEKAEPCKISTPVDFNEQIDKVQEIYSISQKVIYAASLIWVLFLIGTFLIFLPYPRRGFHWFAIALFCPSAVILASAIVGLHQLQAVQLSSPDPAQQFLQQLLFPVVKNLGSSLANKIETFAVIGIITAIVSFIVAFAFIKPVKKKKV